MMFSFFFFLGDFILYIDPLGTLIFFYNFSFWASPTNISNIKL